MAKNKALSAVLKSRRKAGDNKSVGDESDIKHQSFVNERRMNKHVAMTSHNPLSLMGDLNINKLFDSLMSNQAETTEKINMVLDSYIMGLHVRDWRRGAYLKVVSENIRVRYRGSKILFNVDNINLHLKENSFIYGEEISKVQEITDNLNDMFSYLSSHYYINMSSYERHGDKVMLEKVITNVIETLDDFMNLRVNYKPELLTPQQLMELLYTIQRSNKFTDNEKKVITTLFELHYGEAFNKRVVNLTASIVGFWRNTPEQYKKIKTQTR